MLLAIGCSVKPPPTPMSDREGNGRAALGLTTGFGRKIALACGDPPPATAGVAEIARNRGEQCVDSCLTSQGHSMALGITAFIPPRLQTPVVFLTLSVFMIPLGKEFGWDRAQVSLGLSVAALSLAIAMPMVGKLLDRFGSRRVLFSSMLLYGLATISLCTLGPSLWHFDLSFAAIGLLGAGSNTMSYARVLSAWFNRRRGLALGITMAGIPLGKAAAILAAQLLIDSHGWRVAYAVLGPAVLVIGLPEVYWLVRESPQEMGLLPDGDVVAAKDKPNPSPTAKLQGGLNREQSIHTREFWMLIAVFFLVGVAIHGIQIHLVPLLRDAGISPRMAAGAAGAMALTGIVGRVVVGFLFDHYFAPRVAIAAFLCPALAFILLQGNPVVALAFACAVLMEIGASSESDLLAYLTGRYFGLRSFGEIYGYIFATFMIGTAIGPYAVGLGYELMGSYREVLWASFGGTLMICAVVSRLGPFPIWDEAERPTA